MLISITNIISGSLALYKRHIKTLFPYVLILFCVASLKPILQTTLALTMPYGSIGNIGTSFLLFIILVIVISLVSFLISLGIIRVIAKLYTGQAVETVGKEISDAKALFWPGIGVSILTGLAIVGGFILLIIPGIIFLLWFAFSIYSVAVDTKAPVEAMKTSKRLVDGRWWAVLFRLLVPAFVFGLCIAIVTGIVSFPIDYILKGTPKGSNIALLWSTIGDIIETAISIFLSPLTSAAMIILFLELKKTYTEKETNTPPPIS